MKTDKPYRATDSRLNLRKIMEKMEFTPSLYRIVGIELRQMRMIMFLFKCGSSATAHITNIKIIQGKKNPKNLQSKSAKEYMCS